MHPTKFDPLIALWKTVGSVWSSPKFTSRSNVYPSLAHVVEKAGVQERVRSVLVQSLLHIYSKQTYVTHKRKLDCTLQQLTAAIGKPGRRWI